jgi:hypothetical protein
MSVGLRGKGRFVPVLGIALFVLAAVLTVKDTAYRTESNVPRKPRTIPVTLLCLLLIPLLSTAIIVVLYSMDLLELPVDDIWDGILTNVGYNVTAGALLIFLVAIFEKVLGLLRPDTR